MSAIIFLLILVFALDAAAAGELVSTAAPAVPIVLPPDKVMMVSQNALEFEFHGEYQLSPAVEIYEHDGDQVRPIPFNNFKVGAEEVRATVHNGEIIQLDMMKPQIIRKMRVAITKANFAGIEHKKLTLSAVTRLFVQEKRTGRGFVVQPGQTVQVSASEGRLVLIGPQGEELEFCDRVYISPEPGGMIQIDSFQRGSGTRFFPKYRGLFELTVVGEDTFQVINEVGLEEYLYQVVPSEMPVSWSLEALKAQAVAARTFAVAQVLNSRNGARGFHVDDSTSSQVYNNQPEANSARQAIDATHGLILTNNDGAITSTYFYQSSPADKESPYYRWEFTLTGAELNNMVRKTATARSIGDVTDLDVLGRNDQGYITALQVEGTKGNTQITGEFNIRSMIRPENRLLPSACFSMDITRDEVGKITQVSFVGSGSGHGMGMSQWGAKAMAEASHSYEEILGFYYPEKQLVSYFD